MSIIKVPQFGWKCVYTICSSHPDISKCAALRNDYSIARDPSNSKSHCDKRYSLRIAAVGINSGSVPVQVRVLAQVEQILVHLGIYS